MVPNFFLRICSENLLSSPKVTYLIQNKIIDIACFPAQRAIMLIRGYFYEPNCLRLREMGPDFTRSNIRISGGLDPDCKSFCLATLGLESWNPRTPPYPLDRVGKVTIGASRALHRPSRMDQATRQGRRTPPHPRGRQPLPRNVRDRRPHRQARQRHCQGRRPGPALRERHRLPRRQGPDEPVRLRSAACSWPSKPTRSTPSPTASAPSSSPKPPPASWTS